MKTSPDIANFDTHPTVSTSQYDLLIRPYTAAYEPLFAMASAFIRSIVGEKADLLIVGAGTGMEICTFGRGNPGWHMTGVDPSGEMLAIARKKIEEAGLASQAKLLKGYVHDLPEEEKFDGATCILVMHFLPDDGSKLQLLESIGRRLRPGSPLILVDGFGVKGSEPFDRTVTAWKNFVIAQGIDPQMVDDAFSGQILKRLQYVPEERIAALLAEAGFGKPSRFYTGFLYGGWVATKQ